MGYKFDYFTHSYDTDIHRKLPDLLITLFKTISMVLGCKNYNPEISIINFYPAIGGELPRSKCAGLCGHQDIYESNLQNPLISISFGQPCIYLLGDDTKENEPIGFNYYQFLSLGMYFTNGDIMIMQSEARTAFHAVPIVFCGTKFQNTSQITENNETKEDIDVINYLNNFRVNINVRQMF
uniref:Alpha-ketoglutarate-dependent dioxygenase alkB (Trinotate prediction) n=1 Tax=Henneguya salminicola TaxID=69463 RepID=A0A6G3MIS7_HENSL